MPYIRADGTRGMIKGYICPIGQVCKACQPLEQICVPYSTIYQEGDNPFNNIESYDNFFYAALQVAIISTQTGVRSNFRLVCVDPNTILQFTGPMYLTIDSEYFLSCFFYIFCIIVLNLWLINLFVAVITNTFSAIRKETRKSAFGAAA